MIQLNPESAAMLTRMSLPPDLDDAADLRECFQAFRPLPVMRLLHWSCEHVINDEGRPYDHSAFPHLGAPGGPMDAADDETVRTISLQFATRLGKTFFGQCLIISRPHLDPCPMLVAADSERNLKQRLMKRLYKMVYARQALSARLLKRSTKDHKQDQMEFTECTVSGAWARSPGTLADLNIKVGIANELDKSGWDGHSTSTEAAPLKLFNERFKDYQSTRKIVYESTPTITGRSRIERLRLQSTNCQFWVPCPHCGKYQILRMGEDAGERYDNSVPGSLRWEGKDKASAKATAYYHCISDECEPIRDEHRAMMMRRGVWAPEGCTVDDREAAKASMTWLERLNCELEGETFVEPVWQGWKRAKWLVGTPVRLSEDAGYQLPSLCALSLSWGHIAEEYVASLGKPRELHNFENSWLANTYELVEKKQTWEQLGNRLIRDVPENVVPEGFSVLTIGVDKQSDGRHPFVVKAWDHERRSHTVTYGECNDPAELESLLMTKFQHADGGPPVKITFGLIDSGFRPKGVGEFCAKMIKKGVKLFPCKGANTMLDAVYKLSRQKRDSAMPGMCLFRIDMLSTQDFIDQQLHSLEYPDRGAMSLFSAPLTEHQDYLEQLLNDAPVSLMDNSGKESVRWERPNREVPNDFRDCERYAYVAFLRAMRGKSPRKRLPPSEKPQRRPERTAPPPSGPIFLERPGGWV